MFAIMNREYFHHVTLRNNYNFTKDTQCSRMHDIINSGLDIRMTNLKRNIICKWQFRMMNGIQQDVNESYIKYYANHPKEIILDKVHLYGPNFEYDMDLCPYGGLWVSQLGAESYAICTNISVPIRITPPNNDQLYTDIYAFAYAGYTELQANIHFLETDCLFKEICTCNSTSIFQISHIRQLSSPVCIHVYIVFYRLPQAAQICIFTHIMEDINIMPISVTHYFDAPIFVGLHEWTLHIMTKEILQMHSPRFQTFASKESDYNIALQHIFALIFESMHVFSSFQVYRIKMLEHYVCTSLEEYHTFV